DIGINEVQAVNLDSLPEGHAFILDFNGQKTQPILVGASSDETVENIKNALNNLNLGDGAVINVAFNQEQGYFEVVFSGDGIGETDLSPMDISFLPLDSSGINVIEEVAGSNNILTTDPTISFHKADHQTTISVFDSQGNSHEASVLYYKSADNKWLANVTIDGQMIQLKSSPSQPLNTEFNHEIEFSQAGEIIKGDNLRVRFDFGNSLEPLEIQIDFAGLTQVAMDTTALGLSQDGFEPGNLESISVDTVGKIVGTYSNGQNIELAQVAIATFRNPSGLMKVGNTLFTESKNSGSAQVGTAGTADRGVIKPETLEMSNVDLSQEFVDMIITQRGFQANSRIITTSDEMLQELVNLRR
ncbi:MAG: flagellar hook-basal body complex protein, partial [Peptococcales bacterium]